MSSDYQLSGPSASRNNPRPPALCLTSFTLPMRLSCRWWRQLSHHEVRPSPPNHPPLNRHRNCWHCTAAIRGQSPAPSSGKMAHAGKSVHTFKRFMSHGWTGTSKMILSSWRIVWTTQSVTVTHHNQFPLSTTVFPIFRVPEAKLSNQLGYSMR